MTLSSTVIGESSSFLLLVAVSFAIVPTGTYSYVIPLNRFTTNMFALQCSVETVRLFLTTVHPRMCGFKAAVENSPPQVNSYETKSNSRF